MLERNYPPGPADPGGCDPIQNPRPPPGGRLSGSSGVVMTERIVITVAVLVFLVVATELIAAVLPLLIVVLLVPPEERHGLAELLAATDSSRRLRLWPALRAAVKARRAARTGGTALSGRSRGWPY